MIACLAGCAGPPSLGADADLLAVQTGPGAGRHMEVLRQQEERLAHKPFLDGNKVDLLVDGPASFAALSDLIDGAQTRVDMESYEFDQQAGSAFADHLLAASARGVQVYLIYDAFGAAHTPAALFDRLQAGGVNVLEYNPLRPNGRVPVSVNKRDHRKLLCVDGAVAITGGVNISRVYENAPGPIPANPDDEAWRDTDVRVQGPAVAQFEHYFDETWHDQKGPPLPPAPDTPATRFGPSLVQGIDGAPGKGHPLIYRTLIAAFELSQRSIHLTTGFFVPTPDLKHALIKAARRGVDVQVIVPGRSTSGAAVAAGRADYGELLEAGVQIHERQGEILHAKTAVIDGEWSAVGSSNLDFRSADLNNEIDAIILDPAFGAQMEALFAGDIAQSHTVDLAAWRRRPIGERFDELEAKFIQPLL